MIWVPEYEGMVNLVSSNYTGTGICTISAYTYTKLQYNGDDYGPRVGWGNAE